MGPDAAGSFSMFEALDFLRPFFMVALAIMDLGTVFFSPVITLSSPFRSIGNFCTVDLEAVLFVLNFDNSMSPGVTFTSPHGFSGLLVKEVDGVLASTIW